MSFPVSPGITTNEVDLTTSIPAVATSIGGFVGTFNWGPVNFVTPISTQVQLVATFSEPDNTTAESFFTAWNFLSYSNNINIVRAQGQGMLNATGSNTGIAIEIDNPSVYFNGIYNTTLASNNYIARFPGTLGNSISVITFANGAAWQAAAQNPASPLFTFANYFSWMPNTTPFTAQVSAGAVTGDEVHILVVDAGGLITGNANSVLEVYQGLSIAHDALNAFGQSNYYKEVIWSQSQFIYNVGIPQANTTGWGNTVAQQIAAGNAQFGKDASANVVQFANGNNGVVTSANVITGWELMSDPTFVQINLAMTGTSNTTVQNFVIQDIAAVRKDCVAFCSAPLAADQLTGAGNQLAGVLAWGSNVAFNSYAVLDTGYKYQFDQYNDVFRFVPLNGDIAGLCARTDQTNAPWWSPAGLQRGIINNVTSLPYNPGQTDRNALYLAGINPVVSLPGQGTLLYGDKTHLNFDSAFDHINVRRLFIVLEQQISLAARSSLFEFNDTFTRAQFVALITPYLRTVQGQRGITAFQVVCDTTNNTPAIIDANQFVGDIYIQPARSINFILLNFVAVATGVNFSEVIGQAGIA
jgi:phage tail sheath protein FI